MSERNMKLKKINISISLQMKYRMLLKMLIVKIHILAVQSGFFLEV